MDFDRAYSYFHKKGVLIVKDGVTTIVPGFSLTPSQLKIILQAI